MCLFCFVLFCEEAARFGEVSILKWGSYSFLKNQNFVQFQQHFIDFFFFGGMFTAWVYKLYVVFVLLGL